MFIRYQKALHVLLGIFTCLASTFILSQNAIAQSDWELEKQDDGISIFSRAVDYSDFREFRAEMTINATIDSVVAVFQDPNSFTRWVHQCSSAEVIKQESFLDIYVYQVSDMPLIVSDRDIVIRDVYTYSDDYKKWTIDVQAVTDLMPETDLVRITQSKGIYALEDIGNNQVKITWNQHADPAGALPSWLVNSLIVDFPFNTLNNLRELTQEEQYATAKIGYDENGVPTHWAVRNF